MALTIPRSLFEAIEQDFDDVREDYSGRGMYGKGCFGIVTDMSGWELRGELQDMQDYLDDDEKEELETLLSHTPRTDNMGLSTIYYWPSVTVDDED